jgi:hypothetical protein
MVFPSTRAEIGAEVLALVGGSDAILRRVSDLSAGDEREAQLALHLLDFVIFGGGEHAAAAHRQKATLLDRRAAAQQSFVAANVLRVAAEAERDRATHLG